MEFLKFYCTSCGSTQCERVKDGFRCRYCGNIQNIITANEEKPVKQEEMASQPEKGAKPSVKTKIETKDENKTDETKNIKAKSDYKYSILKFIICILGGWFGLHKFIEGELVSGLIYFFSFGLFGIGWIVDIVRLGVEMIKEIQKARAGE